MFDLISPLMHFFSWSACNIIMIFHIMSVVVIQKSKNPFKVKKVPCLNVLSLYLNGCMYATWMFYKPVRKQQKELWDWNVDCLCNKSPTYTLSWKWGTYFSSSCLCTLILSWCCLLDRGIHIHTHIPNGSPASLYYFIFYFAVMFLYYILKMRVHWS